MRRLLMFCAVFVLSASTASGKDVTDADLPGMAFDTKWLLPTADAKLPKGWALRPESPEGEARTDVLVAALRETLKPAVPDPSQVMVLARELQGPETAGATIMLVRAPSQKGSPPTDVLKTLEAAATGKGWVLKEVGTPAIVLLVSAPEAARKDLLAAAAQWGAESLSLQTIAAQQKLGPHFALANLLAALALDPRNVQAHFRSSQLRFALALNKVEHGSLERAAEHGELALAKDPAYPFTTAKRFEVVAEVATTFLYAKGREEKAHAALTEALADPGFRAGERGWGARYNLACASARVKKLDQAFTELGTVLAEDAKNPLTGIEHWREDPDFESLRADPRWKALLEKYPEEK